MDLRATAQFFGTSIETARLIRLPFSDAKRRVPAQELAERIHARTHGAILPGHFFPPGMRGRGLAAAEATA